MTTLLLLALALAAQDAKPDVKTLIEQLGSDDVAARGEAIERLYRLGRAIRKDLEPHLASKSPDIVANVRDLIARLDRDEKLARFLPPERFVTIPQGTYTFGKLLDQIREQAGMSVTADNIQAATEVEGGWEEAPLLKVLDEMCRKLGRGDVLAPAANRAAAGLDDRPNHLVIRGGQPLPHAVAHWRQFRAVVTQVMFQEQVRLSGASTSRGSVHVEVQALPGFDPIHVGRLEVLEVVDDKGKSLLVAQEGALGRSGHQPEPELGDHAASVWYLGESLYRGTPGGMWSIGEASPGATRFRLRARIRMAVPMDQVSHALKVSEFKGRTELAFGATKLTVTSLTAKEGSCTFEYSGVTMGRSPLPEMLDAKGAIIQPRSRSFRGGGDTMTYTCGFANNELVDSIRIRAAVGHHAFDVPLEWAEVPLPKTEEK